MSSNPIFGGVPPNGFRLMPFAPDWSKPVKETTGYLTDVLTAYSDAEQRRSLRANPRRSLAFSIVTMNEREAALLDATFFGWMHQIFGVPWWPDAEYLSADVAQGAASVPVATANRLFAVGGYAAIWQSPISYEVLTVASMDAGSIGIGATQFAWKANQAIVVPVFLGRLPASFDLSRYSSGGIAADLTFAGEAGQLAPASSGTFTQYRGIDVLEVSPNWAGAMKRTIKRSLVVLDSKTGDVTVEPKGSSPVPTAPFNYWIDGRANVASFRAFIDRRRGRLTPFWVPTWDQDLLLAHDVAAADTTIKVAASGYTRYQFPAVSRRDLAFISRAGSLVYARATGSVENGDGTETITFASPIGANLPASKTMISFLVLCRLDQDAIDLEWTSSDHADAVVATAEVPREVPA
jgi:hypothetical protein